jgi:hypothetical protein
MRGKSGTVVLFLSHLPPNTNCRDIKAFMQAELRKSGVRGLPFFNLCTNCSILRITDPAAGTTEYHGLVEVRPALIALRAIEVLNGKELNGAPIAVRRYRHRSTWGEHRHRSDPARGGDLVAAPLVERRRANLRIELVEATPAAALHPDLPLTLA